MKLNAFEFLETLLCIWEVPGSILGLEASCYILTKVSVGFPQSLR